MTTIFEISEHPFARPVLENVQPLMVQSLKDAPKEPRELAEWRKGNRARMTSAERYAMDVFYRYLNLNRVVERFKVARHLLSRSPSAYKTKKVSLNRNDWTEYHFYVYTTSLASLLDCMLLLIAEVYNLGLPPRFCTFEIVNQHKWIRGTNVAKALRHLKNTLNEYTERRHRYLHRGEESNLGELSDPDDFWHLSSITFLADKVDLNIPRRTIPSLWRLQIRKVSPKLDSFEVSLFRCLSDTLTALQSPYERFLNTYKATMNSSTK